MRLFIAVQFPQEVRLSLCHVIDRLREDSVQGNFTREENLHLTLAFLGEVQKPEAVISAMNRVKAEPFPMELGGFGKFSRDGGDIYWVGVWPNEPLSLLYENLWAQLTQIGFHKENRPFRPHLTLGREVLTKPGFDRKLFEKSVPAMQLNVTGIHLMKSERMAGKLVYTSIFAKPLE